MSPSGAEPGPEGKEGLPACAKPRLQKPCGGQALRRRQGGDFLKDMSTQLWTP